MRCQRQEGCRKERLGHRDGPGTAQPLPAHELEYANGGELGG